MSAAERIRVIDRALVADGRGRLIKLLDGSEQDLPAEVGEVYVVGANPGQTRGGHYHRVAHEWFTVIAGRAIVTLGGAEPGRDFTMALSAETPQTLFVPAGVFHAFLNPADAEGELLIVAYASRRYDPGDTCYRG